MDLPYKIHHGVFVPGSMLELARPGSQPKHNKIADPECPKCLASLPFYRLDGLYRDLILLFFLETNKKYHRSIPWENTTVSTMDRFYTL